MKKIVFKNSYYQRVVGNLKDCGKDYIVIHCHGYGANKDSETARALQAKLSKSEISSFAFDFSDSGESECKKGDLTVTIGLDEIDCAINFFKKSGFKNFALSGSSFGGSVVLNYAVDKKDIKAMALKAPVSEWQSILVSGGSKLRTNKFLDDAKSYAIYDKASKIKCPVLIFHGDQDETVPVEQSKKICKIIRNCQLEIIKGADHQLADHDDRMKLIETFVRFFESHKND